MKIVVVGSQGTLGSELAKYWNDPYVESRIAASTGAPIVESRDEIVAFNLPDFDFCSRALAIDSVLEVKPDVVINAAGVNLIDWLESRPNTARNVHEHGTANLKEAANRCGALLVQFGCGEVFYRSRLERGAVDERERAESPEAARAKVAPFASDADRDLPIAPEATPFDEFTVPNPSSVYAKTKLESERVAAEARESLVLRFSSLFGETTPYSSGNLVSSLLTAFRRAPRVSALDDVLMEPLWALDVLCATKTLIRLGARGLYHLTGGSRATPKEIAEFLLRQTGLRGREVVGITREEYGVQAPRSAFTLLTSVRGESAVGAYSIPDWQTALRDYFARRAQLSGF